MSLMGRDRPALTATGPVLVAALLALAGCAKNGGGASSSPAAQSNAALVAAGRTAFTASGCTRCHAIGGQGGRMGPDLSRVGAQPGRTPQRIAEHIRNPKAHNPSSRMPAFQGRISDRDLVALGAFLASLK